MYLGIPLFRHLLEIWLIGLYCVLMMVMLQLTTVSREELKNVSQNEDATYHEG